MYGFFSSAKCLLSKDGEVILGKMMADGLFPTFLTGRRETSGSRTLNRFRYGPWGRSSASKHVLAEITYAY